MIDASSSSAPTKSQRAYVCVGVCVCVCVCVSMISQVPSVMGYVEYRVWVAAGVLYWALSAVHSQ